MEPYLIPDRRLTARGGEGGEVGRWRRAEGGEEEDTGVFFLML